jgi:hypothetical protein
MYFCDLLRAALERGISIPLIFIAAARRHRTTESDRVRWPRFAAAAAEVSLIFPTAASGWPEGAEADCMATRVQIRADQRLFQALAVPVGCTAGETRDHVSGPTSNLFASAPVN